MRKINIFISYSHKNMKYKEKLLVSLEALKQSYDIETWHDGIIDAGGNIDQHVKKAMGKSDVIILLITDNFLASYYCMKIELEEAMRREKQGKCVVIPVMFQESVLSDTLQFFKHNRVPEDGKPIATGFKNQSLGCTRATNMIKSMIDKKFPDCKKGVSSNKKITSKPPTIHQSKLTNNKCTLHIKLYKNGKLQNVPITQDFLDQIPKYYDSINAFCVIMEQALLDAKKQYSQYCKNNKGADIPAEVKLNYLRLLLMDICAYTKTYITEPAGVKVHFRICKDNNYLGLIASTDDDDSMDLSCDWTTKMTPIPIDKGLIYHSSKLQAPLIKTLNQNLNQKCQHDDIWKDYITFTFPNFHIGKIPLISYCISINKEHYKVKANMLKILAYLNFGNIIEKYIVDYCEICKKLDRSYNIEEIIKSL